MLIGDGSIMIRCSAIPCKQKCKADCITLTPKTPVDWRKHGNYTSWAILGIKLYHLITIWPLRVLYRTHSSYRNHLAVGMPFNVSNHKIPAEQT